jgi:hypothetical protein
MDARTLILVVLAACSGPRPTVEHATVTPSPRPGATRVALDIVNPGGEGSIEIDIELRDAEGHLIRANRSLDIKGGDRAHYETDVETPPGTYTVRASAEYPD